MTIRYAGRAVDFANYTPVPSPAQINELRAIGVDLAIVGASFDQSVFGPNLPKRQLQALQAASMRRHAYSWLKHPFSKYRSLMDKAFEQIAGTGVEMMWVDVEDLTTVAQTTVAQRVNDVWQALDYWKNARPDLLTGIYTGKWWWDAYMPGVTETFGKPLWLAAYVLHEEDIAAKPDGVSEQFLQHFIPGGWKPSDVWLWQYMGSVLTAGLNTDRNLILEAIRMKYTDEKLDAVFGELLRALGRDGQTIVALANGLAGTAQTVRDHIYNNGDVTQPNLAVVDQLTQQVDALEKRTAKFVAAIKAAGVAFDA